MYLSSLTGVIIKRRNFGESDRIITLYTLEKGKVTLKANSVRKLTSKRAGSLELFNLVKVGRAKGRGNFDVITEVEIIDSYASWKKHLGRINIAYQLCEVIDKLTPDNQPQPQIFKILSDSLLQISVLDNDWQADINDWISQIIQELGYWPKGSPFEGNLYEYIEELSNRKLHSPAILSRLRK
ncbi:DNA repair protein RecO [Candidatus Amesbacteria bacterium RIFOXYB1_FULL_44_23]|uniref:DNA repair protein RecO n=1 Tax=Candidatus Amesbacteria bacterium RIFOXYB1_FULL_44_23 TaxID=1797263 RepID=A0A1F4ZWD2_9BACT|nr:MAG: DNA repair protein RecO [Candidatus Amesbacteria bacterium RIFOXYB1_FULL_44_23]